MKNLKSVLERLQSEDGHAAGWGGGSLLVIVLVVLLLIWIL